MYQLLYSTNNAITKFNGTTISIAIIGVITNLPTTVFYCSEKIKKPN